MSDTIETTPRQPPHVTDEMRAFFRDPYPMLVAAREARVFKDELGFWRIARFEDVDAVLKDRRFGKKAPPGTEHRLPANQRNQFSRSILNVDPPDHTRLRGLVVKAFSAPRMESMRPVIQALVDRLLDKHVQRGHMEIMRDLAHPIPATIISDMLGIPDADRERFALLSNDIIRYGNDVMLANTDKADAAVAKFNGYLQELFAAKRNSDDDDLTTALIRAEDEDGKLTEAELEENIQLLFIAGHETTVNLIGNAIIALMKHPDQLDLLKRSPELMPKAVEEFLRFDSSVQQLPRIAQADVEIGGQQILAGEMVVCMLGAANHDPDVYPDPDQLVVDRDFVRSKSFGGGIHFCLGAQLARTETEIALSTLFRRIPDLSIDNLDDVDYPLNPFFRGPVALEASWTPA